MEFFIPKIISYQLYLLQLENYELKRYFRLLFKRGFWPQKNKPLRKELVWTAKARALMLMAASLHVLLIVIISAAVLKHQVSLDSMLGWGIVAFLGGLPLYFLFFSLAILILWPLDAYVKKQLIKKASLKLAKLSNNRLNGGLKVVAVAGSYGKTTLKEVLNNVLSIKYKVLSTPESVNTPVGIARFILSKVNPETEILILELGEHYQGDIRELCQIINPHVSVITGINEAHLERMGNMQNVAFTIFEAVEFASRDALILLNGDDENVNKNFQQFVKPTQKVEFFKTENIKNRIFNLDSLGWKGESGGIEFEINLLGEYALGFANAAIILGWHLHLTDSEIKMGLKQIRPVEHRLEPITSQNDVLIIDDAYNGNPKGVAEAIKVLSRFEGHRKIYVTPGLVETGSAAPEVHREIGRQLAGAADVTILIKNSVTGYIEEGLKQADKHISRSACQLVWFDTAQEAHNDLKNILKPGDVVLFQNDWGDQYL